MKINVNLKKNQELSIKQTLESFVKNKNDLFHEIKAFLYKTSENECVCEVQTSLSTPEDIANIIARIIFVCDEPLLLMQMVNSEFADIMKDNPLNTRTQIKGKL